jgi:hypothetical protein
MIGAFAMRAPEVILAANFDAKVDIWSVSDPSLKPLLMTLNFPDF